MCLDKLPGVAEVAMQTGLYAGRRISHEARGETYDKLFRYHDLGSAAYISRGRAVISAGKLHFGGFLGWWAWLFIHIGFLTGYRNRVGAVLGWWFAFTRDLRRERAFTVDDIPVAAGPYGDPDEPGHLNETG
jgi:NADH dehydrogenase